MQADTSVDVDTVSKTNHVAGADGSAGSGALQWVRSRRASRQAAGSIVGRTTLLVRGLTWAPEQRLKLPDALPTKRGGKAGANPAMGG